jgi:hypothetical protein
MRNHVKLFEAWLNEEESEGPKKIKDMLSMPYDKFVTSLKDGAKDPKVEAVLNMGKGDGTPDDEEVEVKEIDIPAENLFPTQSQIGMDNSLGYLREKDPTGVEKLIKGDLSGFLNNRILTANGKWILDGHHRWSQVYLFNPKAKIPSLDLNLPGLSEMDLLKVVQSAIAATYKNVNQTEADAPTDIFDNNRMPEKDLPKKIAEIAGPQVIQAAKKAWGMKEDEEVIKKMVDNALSIKSKKPKQAPPREYMPQPTATALDSGRSKQQATDYKGMPKEFIDKLKSGDVNFKAPF